MSLFFPRSTRIVSWVAVRRADARTRSQIARAANGAAEPARKKRKKLAPLRVNLNVMPSFYKVDHTLPKCRLRQRMKNLRGVMGNGVHVAPCSFNVVEHKTTRSRAFVAFNPSF